MKLDYGRALSRVSRRGPGPGASREELCSGRKDDDPEEPHEHPRRGIGRPVRSEVHPADRDPENDDDAGHEREGAFHTALTEVENDGHQAAEEDRGHGRVTAREAVRLLGHERGPEVRTRAPESELEGGLEPEASEDAAGKQKRGDP